VRDLFDAGDMKNGQPIVWGYQFTMGPDGIPHYSAYSNVDKIQKQLQSQFPSSTKELPALQDQPTLNETTTDGFRLAHYDVVQDDDMLRVIIELPGVEKKDIDVKAKESFLTVTTTDTSAYKYKAEIPLKVTTLPKKIKASFKNGILELKLPIAKKETADQGDKVSID